MAEAATAPGGAQIAGHQPVEVGFRCDGLQRSARVEADRLLLDVLREELDLTGAKLGCGTGDCGACTVLLDAKPVNACLVYAVECEGLAVVTPEGAAASESGRVIVEELVRTGGVQCGICTPGFVVSALAAIGEAPATPSREEIQVALAGNLCRCTGYVPIIEAVSAAAERINAAARRPS